VASQRAKFHAPWSASKVQSALLCPRLFHYRYVEKVKEPEVMPEARLGKVLHTVLEHALLGKDLDAATEQAREQLVGELEKRRFNALLPMVPRFLERIAAFRQKNGVGRGLVEYFLAMREDESSTAFHAKDAYFRGVVDVGYLFGDSLAMVDHKTGARFKNDKIVDQLEGYAVLAAAQFRRVRKIWLGVHWVADGDVSWAPPIWADDVREKLTRRVFDNIEAAALAVSDGPRTSQGVWCYRCNYRSICPASIDVRYESVEEEPEPWE